MTWDNHRWIRYHSSVSLLEQFMGEFAETLEHPEPGDTTIMSLINRGDNDPPHSYKFTPQRRADAREVTGRLTNLASRHEEQGPRDGRSQTRAGSTGATEV